MTKHRIGTQEEWQAERDELLKEEKELTRRGDELARKRRELPWVPVEKDYRFDTEDGTKTLADLFDGRSQLLVYHFMCGTDVAGYVSQGPGLSVYALSDGTVYRTYVTSARGLEPAMAYYGLLDWTPKGRDESTSRPLWVRRHDEYQTP